MKRTHILSTSANGQALQSHMYRVPERLGFEAALFDGSSLFCLKLTRARCSSSIYLMNP